MMLNVVMQIEEILKMYTEAYIFSNDENLNVLLRGHMNKKDYDKFTNTISNFVNFKGHFEDSSGRFKIIFYG